MKLFQMTNRPEEKEGLVLGGLVLLLLGVALSIFLPQESLASLFICNFGVWMMTWAYKSRKVTKMPRWILKIGVWGNLAASGVLICLIIVKIFGW